MRSLALCFVVTTFALVGCGDDVKIDPPHTAPAGSAALSTSAPPVASAAPPPGVRREFPESDFTETERSRDPFRPYA